MLHGSVIAKDKMKLTDHDGTLPFNTLRNRVRENRVRDLVDLRIQTRIIFVVLLV